MNGFWLVRCEPEGRDRTNTFLDEGIIAIGWGKIGDLTNCTKEDIERRLKEKGYIKNQEGKRSVAVVENFLNQMRIDDYVVAPNGADIHIGQITSSYHYDEQQSEYPHQRTCRWLKHILRDELPPDLRASLRTRSTIANLKHRGQEIMQIISQNEGRNAISSLKPDGDDKSITVQYPLRLDYNVSILIPRDISESEANRLSDFVRTLHSFE